MINPLHIIISILTNCISIISLHFGGIWSLSCHILCLMLMMIYTSHHTTVKDMCTLLSPPIAVLFNLSLATGCFPTEFKEAVVRPRLKKLDLTPVNGKTTNRCQICPSSPNFWKGWFRLDYKHFLTPMG